MNTPIKLYSGPASLFTAKVRIALAEKGIDYELIDVPWSVADRYEPKHPQVARINPKAQVPCLVDGALELYDSTVILEYLEEIHPQPALYPREAAARARCRLLELEADEVFFAPVWTLIDERFYPEKDAGRDTTRADEAVRRIAWYYARLADTLGERDYLCDDFGVADITHFLVAYFATSLGAPVPDKHANLVAWNERLLARESFTIEVAGMTAAVVGASAAA